MKSVFYNGQVYTGALPLQKAFAVEDGIFTAVGSNEELLARKDAETQCVDLNGCFVCAGFNDSHMHLLNYGRYLSIAHLSEHTGSLAEMLAFLREYAQENPPQDGQWLMGRGWNQDYFTDVQRMPHRADLDAISTEYPIMVTRTCGHCVVVNSRALEIAGITAETPVPEGGAVGMENGKLDGRLYENAIGLLSPFIPTPGKEEIKNMLRRACEAANTYGITSVQSDDYDVFAGVSYETINAAYRELEESGELTVRVCEQANFSSVEDLQKFVEAGYTTGVGNDRFKIGPLKIVDDGSLGSRTAHLSRPYADQPDTCGFSTFSPAELQEMISYANAHGMQVAIHAIGDACLDEVLDAIGTALQEHPREDHRHGIVHCQISRADQLERIRDLGLHVYAQSVFLDYDNHIVEACVGPELAATSYNWKTLLQSGVSVSNGSDCPVELPDVMKGIECAVTRTSLDGTGPYLPEQTFTVKEALDSFTIRSAEASFEEDRKGRIAPGYAADFTVLRQNPFETEEKKIHTIAIEACWLAGKRVYENE